MRSLLAFGFLLSIARLALAVPLVVKPGDEGDIIITEDNTLNQTSTTGPVVQEQAAGELPISVVNNLPGGDAVFAYVTGKDPNGNIVLLQPDGQWYHPEASDSQVPVEISVDLAIPLGGQGSTTDFTIPTFLSAGRIYISVGKLKFHTVKDGAGNLALVEPSALNPSDPSAGLRWGFVELTNTEEGGIYANISYVDFVGLILGMTLTTTDGGTQSALGLEADAMEKICNDLRAQAASDGQPWDKLCVTDSSGNQLRVLSPNYYLDIDSNAFSGYYDQYINDVYAKYADSPLTIDTQSGAGKVACKTGGTDTLTCEGDNRGYQKPTVRDIFGCNSGPFTVQEGDNAVHAAVVPRLCAAFHRTTLLLEGGDVQPSLDASHYYTTPPSNYYSAIVHKYEVDGRGYAFSYDDVNPAGEDMSGTVSAPNPAGLKVTVGGPQ
ncbi:hypothetical protein VTN49DRAFT_2310 [Thermomyces lanuginosus]|uniref:uncharacterized protein n=1 Tax=Thermomyces lanuginosus TaxID=5541 RepID=UPI003741F7D6